MGYFRRRIRMSSRTEKKSNEEVMEMSVYKRSLLKTIRKRHLHIFEHTNRADGLEKITLSGKICASKSRERQHKIHRQSE